jgi:hypothetical protein
MIQLLNKQKKVVLKFEGNENKGAREKFSKGSGEGQHGNHPNYSSEIGRRLAEFREKNPGASPEEAAKFLRNVVKDVKEKINNNPDKKVNDLFKSNSNDVMKQNEDKKKSPNGQGAARFVPLMPA